MEIRATGVNADSRASGLLNAGYTSLISNLGWLDSLKMLKYAHDLILCRNVMIEFD